MTKILKRTGLKLKNFKMRVLSDDLNFIEFSTSCTYEVNVEWGVQCSSVQCSECSATVQVQLSVHVYNNKARTVGVPCQRWSRESFPGEVKVDGDPCQLAPSRHSIKVVYQAVAVLYSLSLLNHHRTPVLRPDSSHHIDFIKIFTSGLEW